MENLFLFLYIKSFIISNICRIISYITNKIKLNHITKYQLLNYTYFVVI